MQLRNPTFLLGSAVVAFGIAFAVFVALEVSADKSVDAANRWVTHTLQVQRRLNIIQSDLDAAEAAQIAHILTGDSSYLASYNRTTNEIDRTLVALTHLVADNSGQARRIYALQTLFHEQRREMDSSVETMRSGDPKGALLIARTSVARLYPARIHKILNETSQAEGELEVVRQKKLKDSARTRDIISAGLIATLAILFAGLIAATRRAGEYENFIKVCSWSNTVNYDGRWISYDQYLQERFNVFVSHGISPQELEKIEREIPHEPDAPPAPEAGEARMVTRSSDSNP